MNNRTVELNAKFIKAAADGDIASMKTLLDQGADVDFESKDATTAIYAAIRANKLEAVEFLLGQGAEVNYTLQDGMTPLYYAAQKSTSRMVSLLLHEGAVVDYATTDGSTPLFAATSRDNLDAVITLLKHGAYINSMTVDGVNALYVAAKANNAHIIKILITHLIGQYRNYEIIQMMKVNHIFNEILQLNNSEAVNGELYKLIDHLIKDKSCAKGAIELIHGSHHNKYNKTLGMVASNGDTETLSIIVRELMSSQYSIFELNKYLLKNNFGLVLTKAKDTESFFALLEIIDYLHKNHLGPDHIKALMPESNSFVNKSFTNHNLKSDIIEKIKSLPINERITMCNNALDEQHPLGYIMFMKRGKTACKLGHGKLKEIAEIRDNATQLKQLAECYSAYKNLPTKLLVEDVKPPVTAAIASTAEITASLTAPKTSSLYPDLNELRNSQIQLSPYVPAQHARIEMSVSDLLSSNVYMPMNVAMPLQPVVKVIHAPDQGAVGQLFSLDPVPAAEDLRDARINSTMYKLGTLFAVPAVTTATESDSFLLQLEELHAPTHDAPSQVSESDKSDKQRMKALNK